MSDRAKTQTHGFPARKNTSISRRSALLGLAAGLPGNTRELRSHVVDDVEIAVRATVVAQAEIGANRLSVRCVHLEETREGQESVEGVIPLQTR